MGSSPVSEIDDANLFDEMALNRVQINPTNYDRASRSSQNLAISLGNGFQYLPSYLTLR